MKLPDLTTHSQPRALRVVPGADGVSIWSEEIFQADASALREFLVRAFSVSEVEGVDLRRAASFGRIRYAGAKSPANIWRKLSRALRGEPVKTNGGPKAPAPPRALDASALYLEGPADTAVRVSRAGNALTTWRLRGQRQGTLHLSHPWLRWHRDVAFRLEEELAAIYGVEDFSTQVWSGGLTVRFDTRALSASRLTRQLESAWPRLLEGLSPPPRRTRLFVATGLLGLAYTGQYLVPAVRPAAVVGAALYSSPNVLAAAKDLTRGQIGLPALYTTGLALMLTTGMPFSATVFATLMQVWPNLSRHTLIRSQRRLFAPHRQRPVWVRLAQGNGTEVEVHASELQGGEEVVVRSGEVVPVDGVVTSGLAALLAPAALGYRIEDVGPGDSVLAGSTLRDGTLTLRVERAGSSTFASHVDGFLPHTALLDLPSAEEVERVANRNAKPALALAAASLLATRTLRLGQVVIRPDYATAPRVSVQLSALHGFAHALQHGIVLRHAGALDHLANAEVYVLDESADLERAQLEVTAVELTRGASEARVLQHAITAYQSTDTEQARALASAAERGGVAALRTPVSRHAGASRFRDAEGSTIEVAATPFLRARGIAAPPAFESYAAEISRDPAQRPLWVLRNGHIIGVVRFARRGDPAGRQLVRAIKSHDRRARVIYLSHATDADVQALGADLGVDAAYGGLSHAAKTQLLKNTPRKTLWLGAGHQPELREAIAASTVSVSLTPAAQFASDVADVWLGDVGLTQLPVALGLARAHAGRLSSDYRAVYAVNLLGVAGGFAASFTGLQAGLLSNAGTFFVYARRARALDRLAAEAEVTRDRLKRALHP